MQPESGELDVGPAEPADLAGAEARLGREPDDHLLARRLAGGEETLELGRREHPLHRPELAGVAPEAPAPARARTDSPRARRARPRRSTSP